jgi:hypothetical protein
VLSATEVSADALGGFVGGGAGHVASEFVHIPDDPSFNFNGRNGRVNNQAYRQALRDLRAQNTSAYINQDIRSGLASSAATHTTNDLFDWVKRWIFDQAPPRASQPYVTVTITSCADMKGNACQ